MLITVRPLLRRSLLPLAATQTQRLISKPPSHEERSRAGHPGLPPGERKPFFPSDFASPAPVYASPREAFGNTPLVALPFDGNKFGVLIHSKLEMSPNNSSIKDRIGFYMLEQALAKGRIKPGDTIIEPTAGNTGISFARAATMWNQQHPDLEPLKCVIVMPENYPGRVELIEAFGGQVILTPAALGVEEARRVAQRLQEEGLGKVLDQFNNPDNWRAHFEITAPELAKQLLQLPGKVDTIVVQAGSGGTSRGIVLGLRELARTNPELADKLEHTRFVFVVPEPGNLIPGIRRWSPADKPGNYDLSLADHVCSVTAREAKKGSQHFAKHGLLVGPSGGAGLCAAQQRARELVRERQARADQTGENFDGQEANIIMFACDSGVPYMETLYKEE